MSKRAGKAPSQRQLRVGEELRHTLADLMERVDFRDPSLVDVRITVTEVRVSPDLRNATVFIVPLGGGDAGPVLEGLTRVKSFLRRHIAGAVRLHFVPQLSFAFDESFDTARHIETLLHRPEVLRDLDTPPDDEEEG